ncbi:MAG: S9 family peptidase, partial [Byssovorax sp.]
MLRSARLPLLFSLIATLAGCPPPELAPSPEAPTSPTPPAPSPSASSAANAKGTPMTRRDDVKDTLHGTVVEDPYRWLEDVKAPEVQAWMTAQDAVARAELARLPEREAIAARLKELFYIDSLGAPQRRGNRYFYRRRLATKEKAIIYWKEGKDGKEQVLFDPNTWSTDGSTTLGSWSVSWDGKTVAFGVHKNNSDEATLEIMDVATGKKRETEAIAGAKYATASWTPTGDGFYYTWVPTDPAIKP